MTLDLKILPWFDEMGPLNFNFPYFITKHCCF